MNIFGTLTATVLKLVVLAATFALIYVFIVRPVLDTTETVSSGITDNIERTQRQVNRSIEQSFGQQQAQRLQHQIQSQVEVGGAADGTQNSMKLLRCVQSAQGDVHKMQACVARN